MARRVRHGPSPLAIAIGGAAVLVILLGIPMIGVVVESFRHFESGRVGGQIGGAFTLENYTAFVDPVYLTVFRDTFLLSTMAAFLSVALGFPIAAVVVLSQRRPLRRAIIAILVAALFLNTITRVYSIAISFSPAGFGIPLARAFGLTINSPIFRDATLVAGLLHFTLPIATLTMIGVVQSLDRRLLDAAMSLGASTTLAHLTITFPLCLRGLASAFALVLTIGISSFVVPLVLGKGLIDFVANLIFRRFRELANYPSGAALAVLLLAVSTLVFLATSRFGEGRRSS